METDWGQVNRLPTYKRARQVLCSKMEVVVFY